MLNGHRPLRPDNPELSNRVWKLIQDCWASNPTKRKTMAEVVAVLEAEVNAHNPRPRISSPLS